MTTKGQFAKRILAEIHQSKILGIRIGTDHRFIGVWAVVVENRVFVRSWSFKPEGWYWASLEEPHGAINIEGREIAVRTVRPRSERLKRAVDRAYLEKYSTPGSIKYAKDLGRAKSRATTTELVPT